MRPPIAFAYATTTPAYPTTMLRSPETSPEVAYFTSSADFAPNCRTAVSMATDRARSRTC